MKDSAIEARVSAIIDKEIYVNASPMVSEISKGDGAYYDDLIQCLYGNDYSEAPEGYTIQKESDAPNAWWGWAESDDSYQHSTEREAIAAAWDDASEEPEIIEALQHWIVSDWLADELEEVGALVARDILGFNIWGRTECGQSLTMDSYINKVARNVELRLADMLADNASRGYENLNKAGKA